MFELISNCGGGLWLISETNWWSVCEWNRVPCVYKKNLGVRVEESSKKPNNLAITFLYQGGQTEIVGVDVAQVNTCIQIHTHTHIWAKRFKVLF